MGKPLKIYEGVAPCCICGEKEGVPTLIAAWNKIHMGRKYNGER